MKILFKELNREKWNTIKTHPYYAKRVENLIKKADTLLETEPMRPLFSDLHAYVTTGDRSMYQMQIDSYSSRLESFFIAYILTEDDKYLVPLGDILWNMLDIRTWALPAHVAESEELSVRHTFIDLVAAGWGASIARVVNFIGDKLPELLVRRAKYELKERIIDSFINNDFWWMHAKQNWPAVCIHGVFEVFAYLATDEEMEKAMPKFLECANNYVDGFDDEGCCQEGYAYWTYGFFAFCIFAEMLVNYTEGKIDYFKDEKVKEIAKFQQNISVNANQHISFSDCNSDFYPECGMSHFIKNKYPDDVAIPPIPGDRDKQASLIRLIFMDHNLADCQMHPKNKIFHKNQWFICRNKEQGYTLVTKAGCNAESHNHNDVGSFIISKNGRVTFTDPGAGEYTRQYFNQGRYDLFPPSSRAHSVPIINGELQVCGEEKCVVLNESENSYVYTMQNAYKTGTVKKLTRGFVCGENITMTDKYEFDTAPTSVTERFISLREITLEDGVIKCGDTTMVFDNELFDISFGYEDIKRTPVKTDRCYFVDLSVKNPTKDMELVFTFK
jgi:hypothetical protein